MSVPFLSPTGPLRPVSATERIQYIDVLRGFALFGVLLANLVWMACDIVLTPAAAAQLSTATFDIVAKYLVVFFVDGKFITLFSFLFAVGFTVQMERAERRGKRGTAAYARRITVLLVIGVLHIVFIWFGDILALYAVLGFVLLLGRNWRPGRAMLLGACILVLFTRVTFGLVQDAWSPDRPPQTAASHPPEEKQQKALASFRGGYESVVRENLRIYWGDLFEAGLIFAILPQLLGKFLLGLYIGKQGYVHNLASYIPTLRQAAPWLLFLGVVGSGVSVACEWAQTTLHVPQNAIWMLALRPIVDGGIVCMSAFYACCIALLLQGKRWARPLTRLAPVGRMALTNYLTHSFFYLFVLTGAGLGLIGRFGATVCAAVSLAVFGVQIVFSGWWLQHFKFGPAEWIWRSVTYGQMQRMREEKKLAEPERA